MTTEMANVDFWLSTFSAMKTVMWKCHMDEYDEGRYGIILGRDLRTALGIDIKFNELLIKGDEEPCGWY